MNTFNMHGNFTVNGDFSSSEYLGLFKPFTNIAVNQSLKWDNVTIRTLQTITLGLGETNAKFVAASVFAFNSNSTRDHVNHIFGYDLPAYNSWCQNDGYFYINSTDPDPSTYVVVSCNGEVGSDYFGNHEFVIIPLYTPDGGEPSMDMVLADGYSYGSHYIKMRIIGYFE